MSPEYMGEDLGQLDEYIERIGFAQNGTRGGPAAKIIAAYDLPCRSSNRRRGPFRIEIVRELGDGSSRPYHAHIYELREVRDEEGRTPMMWEKLIIVEDAPENCHTALDALREAFLCLEERGVKPPSEESMR